jgi:hypothetical protein
MSCSEVEGLGGSGGGFEGDPCGRGLRAGGGGCAWRVRSPSWCRGSRTRDQRTGFGGRIAGASARTSMHLQHRPRLNLISRRMVVGVGRSPAGMDRCVWVNRTLASCASGGSRRCPGQRSAYGLTADKRHVVTLTKVSRVQVCRVQVCRVQVCRVQVSAARSPVV